MCVARPAGPHLKPQGLIKLADWVLIPGYRSSRPCLNAENGQRLDLGCEDRVQLQHSNVTYYWLRAAHAYFQQVPFNGAGDLKMLILMLAQDRQIAWNTIMWQIPGCNDGQPTYSIAFLDGR